MTRIDLNGLRQQLKARRADLADQFTINSKLRPYTHGLVRCIDAILRQLWKQFDWPNGSAFAAVGGYGRGELFPGSDIDLLILLPDRPLLADVHRIDAQLADQVTQLVSQCWDIGLEIGHSVRTVEECLSEAAADVTVQTSLLEARWLAGGRNAFRALSTRLSEVRDPQHFFQAKLLEMQQRHAKFEDTPFSLEPNLKESPGGLRDLQTILWVARAAGLGKTWQDLCRNGLMSRSEARLVTSLENFVKRSRLRLHLLAGRREDRIVFDLQAGLARSFAFNHDSDRRASEQFMQRYYRNAKQVTQATTLLIQSLEERLFPSPKGKAEPLDHEFCIRRGLLDLHDTASSNTLFENEPAAILRAFIRMAENSSLQGMSARLLRAIWRSRDRIDAKFRANPAHRALFMDFIRQPRGITHELRRMNQWSVLGRYLPVFRRIVGRMQHDLFHVYTVDQHILMVVRNLRRFAIPEHAHEYPLCSELMGHFDKPWLLYLAALFHDIAKGRGGDHSKLGARDARRFATQHALTKDESNLLVFLVEHHLTMSSVAQKQDLSDPAVIEAFAKVVETHRRLDALYMLTVADIRGTSPKVWNNWKGKLLADLYHKTKGILSGSPVDRAGMLDRHQADAHARLALYGLTPENYKDFWTNLDSSYFTRTDPIDIAWQTRVLYRHTHTQQTVVRCRLSPFGEGFQVVTYSKDQPELFARICGYFDSQNFSVLDARVYTTLHQYALDSFIVSAPSFADRYRDILQMVEHDLAAMIDQQRPLGQPVKGRPSRRSRYFPVTPKVDLRPDENSQRYLLSVSATDRTGLLFSIAKVMAQHQINLHMARISTLGERVEDTFLIDSPILANKRSQLAFEEDLLGVLAP